MDIAARKIIVENDDKHPPSLTSLLYLPRGKRGRGMRSVDTSKSSNQIVEAVREFEEHAVASGHQSLLKEAAKYAEELNITLQLDILNLVCVLTEGKVVTAARAGNLLKKSHEMLFLEISKDKKWQEKLFRMR